MSLLAAYSVIWSFTTDNPFGSAVYNSYVLQAQRWLSGHLDLGQNYSYLEIAEYGGRYYVSFPPIPSVILLPFIAVFGLNVPDHLIAVIIGIIGALYCLQLALKTGVSYTAAVIWTLLLTAGSNFIHIAYRADVWYFAQNCAFTFTVMSLYYGYCVSKRTLWLPLFCLALAVGCRPLNFVYIPIVLYLLWQNYIRKTGLSNCLRRPLWLLPAVITAVFLMSLNAARFGDIFEFGHNYLSEFTQESPNGQFWIGYIPENLKQMFRLPELQDGRLMFQIFNGTALWLVSPVFAVWLILALKASYNNIKNPLFWLCTVLSVLHLLFLCAHKTLGGWQFGNRYTVDLLPCIFMGILLCAKERRPVLLCPLILWGLGVNLVGTIALMEGWLT